MSPSVKGDDSGAGSREELERQIEAVFHELERRESNLAALKSALAGLHGKLKEVSLNRGYLRGDAPWLANAGAHRRAINKEIAAKEKENEEAFEDVERARQRLKILREELQAMTESQSS